MRQREPLIPQLTLRSKSSEKPERFLRNHALSTVMCMSLLNHALCALKRFLLLGYGVYILVPMTLRVVVLTMGLVFLLTQRVIGVLKYMGGF